MTKIFEKWEVKTTLILLGFVIYGVFSTILLPMLVGLGPLGGFEVRAILEKFWFYSGMSIGFLLGIIAISIASFIIFKEKDKDINGIILHNPEKGVFGFAKKYLTVFNMVFVSLILFGLLGIFSSTTQTFFSEIPETQQQFTETADVMFSVFPASPSETFGLVFVVLLFLFILGLYYKKKNIPKGSFLIISIPIVLVVSLAYGWINHVMRYGQSELSMVVVLLFWGLMGLLIVLTGSIIPSLLLHDTNNLFYKLNILFSSDIVIYATVGILILITTIFIMIKIFGKKKVKKSE